MKKFLLVFVILAFVSWFPSVQQVHGQEVTPNLDLEAKSIELGNIFADSIEIIIEIGATILDSQQVAVDTTTGEIDTIFTFPFDSTVEVPEIITVDEVEKYRHKLQIIGPKGPVNVCRVIVEDQTFTCTEKPGKTCPELKIKKCGTEQQIASNGCNWMRVDPNNPNKIRCMCTWTLPKQKPKIPKPPGGSRIELMIDPDNIMPEYDETNNTISFTYQEDIPSLIEWGVIIFGVVLIGFITYVFLRRRRKAVVSLR